MTRIRRIVLCIIGMASMAAHASVIPPGSDIWIVDLQATAEGLDASAPRNLTARRGYDNQPMFLTGHSLLFTSDANGQADAWRYDLATGEAAPVLMTPESEYSPTAAPQGELSVVRVDMNGVQQLAMLAPGASGYEIVFPMLEGIGYHAWLDGENVALFMVRDPVSELHIANRRSGDVMVLAKNIGRCLLPVPGSPGSMAFVEPGSDGKRWIKQLDFAARRITELAPAIEGSEDFAMLPDGRLIMASGHALLVREGGAWQEFASFESLPGDISRLALSPDGARLAFVVAER